MASPFSLDKGGSMGRDAYAKLVAANMKRYGDRDQAVRRANIEAGFGNSTAQRFLHGGGAKAGGDKAGGGGGKAGGGGGGGDRTSSTKRAPNADMRTPTSAPGFLPDMTTPTSAPGFLPTQSPTSVENPTQGPTTQPGFWSSLGGPTTQPSDWPALGMTTQPSDVRTLGPTTQPSDLPTLGPTTQPGFLPQNAVPPDLAVSPPRSGLNWPGATGRPPVRIPANGRNPPRPPQFVPPNALPPEPTWGFNRGGFQNEPQDPNEGWLRALLRG